MREYTTTGTRDASGVGEICGPSLTIPLDGVLDVGDALPAIELLLAALAADVLAGARLAACTLSLDVGDLDVRVHAAATTGSRLALSYELRVGTTEPEARLAQFHAELRRCTPVMRLLDAATQLTGRVRHRAADAG